MDINKLLAGVACSCGKTHTCDIEYVYIEKNAIRRLGDICRPYRDMVIVADENTFAAAGDATVAALADKTVKRLFVFREEIIVPVHNFFSLLRIYKTAQQPFSVSQLKDDYTAV